MAIDAKVSFLNQTEKRLSSEVTANTMAKVMSIISDVLEGYEMRETFIGDGHTEDLLECYIDALKVQGRSEKTLQRYRYIIGRMIKAVGVPTRRITVYHLRSYLAGLQDHGMADTTAEGIRQVFSSYFNWLQRENLIEKNPTANLGSIKCAKRKKKIFTDIDLFNLKTHCRTERDKAIVMFLASTGCRVSEMTGLDIESVDLVNRQCIVHGKGNKERLIYFDHVTAQVLKKYLAGRNDDNPALFINRFKKRIDADNVRFMLKTVAERAGVEHCHPHKFRRTMATELARRGMPIQEVAAILGHDKIDTTMTYVINDDETVKSNYRKYAV